MSVSANLFFFYFWILLQHIVTVRGECKSSLLSGLPDSAFQSSSEYSQLYNASAARMLSKDDLTLKYRAWCPKNHVAQEEREFLQLDLGRQYFIKLIITKGLSTEDKGGLHLTPHYYIRYRREAGDVPWIKYQNFNGSMRIKGNLDAQTERYVTMNPPFVARYVRIYPFSSDRKTVCLKLDLIGCDAGGLTEYQAPPGTLLPKPGDTRLLDITYDSLELRVAQETPSPSSSFESDSDDDVTAGQKHFISSLTDPKLILSGGLGKLTDGKPAEDINKDPLETNMFVGWKKEQEDSHASQSDYVRIVFRFDGVFNFTSLQILLAKNLGGESSIPRLIEARLSRQFPRASFADPATTLTISVEPSAISINNQDQAAKELWINMDFKNQSKNISSLTQYDSVARFVELRMYFGGSWIVVGEVMFKNAPTTIPPNLDLDKDFPAEKADKDIAETLTTASQRITTVKEEASLGLHEMQPQTYALVVGLGCLALFLVVLVIVLFAHWRRRVYIGGGTGHKLEKLGCSLQQHQSASTPLVKPQQIDGSSKFSLTENDHLMMMMTTTCADAYRPFEAQQQKQLQQMTMGPMFMDARGFLQTMHPAGFPNGNSIIMNHCLRSPMPQHRSPEDSDINNAHTNNLSTEPPSHFQSNLTPYFAGMSAEPGIYTTLPGSSDIESQYPDPASLIPPTHPSALFLQPDSATYVNTILHTPLLRIPPPPQIPLPPPPTTSTGDSVFNLPSSIYSTMSRENNDYLQQRRQDVGGLSYRYSTPMAGGTLGRSYPIYSATTTGINGEGGGGGLVSCAQMWPTGEPAPHFFPQQPQQPIPVQGAGDIHPGFSISEYASPAPINSILYGGYYGSPVVLPRTTTQTFEHANTTQTG